MKKKPIPPDYILKQRQQIGERLRQLREEKQLSQDELADIMQVHRSTISKIETGKFAVTVDYLMKFAWYLDFKIIFESKS